MSLKAGGRVVGIHTIVMACIVMAGGRVVGHNYTGHNYGAGVQVVGVATFFWYVSVRHKSVVDTVLGRP